jgi:hypothetical protein
MNFSLHLILEASLEFFCVIDSINDASCAIFCDIRSAKVSKHLELMKRKAQDCYGRFASPSTHTAPPPSRYVMGSSNCRRTAPPPSRMQEVGSSSHRHTIPPPSSNSDDSVEMWVVAPPPLRLQVAPPPTICLAPPPPPTRILGVPPRQRGELI